MAYIGELAKLPEDVEDRSVNIGPVISSINTDKDTVFFEDLFVSLGQNCVAAEKGIKVNTIFLQFLNLFMFHIPHTTHPQLK